MNFDNRLDNLPNRCYLCGSSELKKVCSIVNKPEQETDFGIAPKDYYREIQLCLKCKVYNNFHNYNFNGLYSKKYNETKYNNKLFSRYNEIMSLPWQNSDNKQRVKRILDFCRAANIELKKAKVLDVGSGLCVFMGELLKHGIEGYCIDPNPISVEHALRNVKVKDAYQGSFMDYKSNFKFSIVTFNKVLEHITKPLLFLRKAKRNLKNIGIIYIELPDGTNALKENNFIKRQEFFIEHYTIFNELSMRYLIENSGLTSVEIQRVRDPSGKYTIYAFCKKT